MSFIILKVSDGLVGGRFELHLATEGKSEQIVSAPLLRSEHDDNGPIVAALVRVAGELLVAEYENQHSILNDAERAKTQAEAFAAGFKKMTEGSFLPPMQGPASVFDPKPGSTQLPCGKCGHLTILGQPCLNCELEAEEKSKPGGQ